MPQLSVAKSQESKNCHAVSLSPLNQSDINQAWESVNSCLPKRAFGVSSGGSTCGGSRQPSPLCNRRQLVRHVSKFRENGTVLVENDYVSGFFPHCAVRSDFTSTWTFSATTLLEVAVEVAVVYRLSHTLRAMNMNKVDYLLHHPIFPQCTFGEKKTKS